MADQQFLSQTGALIAAQNRQTFLVGATMHLFKQGFVPTPINVKADFVAHECDFDGYAPKTIAAWTEIVAAAGTSFLLYAPTQTWIWVFATGIGNMVAGHWIQDSAGNLGDVVIYDTPIPMQGPLQAVVKTPSELFVN